jgi:hypothetical protein
VTLTLTTEGDYGVAIVSRGGDHQLDWNRAAGRWYYSANNHLKRPKGTDALIESLGLILMADETYCQKLVKDWDRRPEVAIICLKWPNGEPWRLKAIACVGQRHSVVSYLICDVDAWMVDSTITNNFLGISEDGRLFIQIVGNPRGKDAVIVPAAGGASQPIIVSEVTPAQIAEVSTIANKRLDHLKAAGDNVEAALRRLRSVAAIGHAVNRTNVALVSLVRLSKGV